MGLLQIIKEQKLKDRSQRVLVLGLDNSGKTTILNYLLGESTNDIQPTVGFRIKTLKLHSKTLQMWDIGGQKTLRPFWFNYFEKTDYMVWVIDVMDRNRVKESLHLLYEIWNENDRINLQFETVVLINKIDLLEDDENPDHVREKLERDLESFIPTTRDSSSGLSPIKVITCSGLNGQGLNELRDFLER